MYGVLLSCSGVPGTVGAAAAADITDEFEHRPWHQHVQCRWDGSKLWLQVDNDYDTDGAALTDEFSDAIAACIAEGFDGSIKIESVTALSGS